MSEELDWPLVGHFHGYPLPDLAKIAPDRWFEALAPLSVYARERTLALCRIARTDEDMREVHLALMHHDAERAGRLRHRAPADHEAPRLPVAMPPASSEDAARVEAARKEALRERRRYARGVRQVNVRLVPEDFFALAEAAIDLGIKPTQLARMLIMDGVRRAEFERERRMLSGP